MFGIMLCSNVPTRINRSLLLTFWLLATSQQGTSMYRRHKDNVQVKGWFGVRKQENIEKVIGCSCTEERPDVNGVYSNSSYWFCSCWCYCCDKIRATQDDPVVTAPKFAANSRKSLNNQKSHAAIQWTFQHNIQTLTPGLSRQEWEGSLCPSWSRNLTSCYGNLESRRRCPQQGPSRHCEQFCLAEQRVPHAPWCCSWCWWPALAAGGGAQQSRCCCTMHRWSKAQYWNTDKQRKLIINNKSAYRHDAPSMSSYRVIAFNTFIITTNTSAYIEHLQLRSVQIKPFSQVVCSVVWALKDYF